MIINIMKKSKVYVIVFLSFLLIIIGVEGFWYFKYQGNLILWISNSSIKIENIEIEIIIDKGEKEIYTLNNQVFHGYQSVPIKKAIGKHQIKVKTINGDANREIELLLIPVRWVKIEIVDSIPYSISDNKMEINVFYSFFPPFIE